MFLQTRLASFGVLFAAAGLLAGCKKDAATFPSLAGTWQLTAHQCYCPQAPLANELVKFTDSGFSFYKDGQPTTYGSYSYTTGQACGSSTTVPMARFAYANANAGPRDIVFTLSGDKLVLDYGGCLDAPVDTYERLR
ncbi:lipocalin family protein [Hymenobacter sp. BT770]|uniref:lipocalin family protein n=1 Tax=Hymenobacter sp. BT770 TaxID=2886942 RepID=UPI001D11D935|nr:lipocalin family protein [Hymenobacter sp. BT770]MCC3155270.1 lipocalin family protein [Hymenobacter sp. BT770]MDO3417265.1 lipocalin family protein [Hymenobacter sp. BT770]